MLGELPFTAELYWRLRQQFKPIQVERPWRKLKTKLPELVAEAEKGRNFSQIKPRRLVVFCGQRYWIEHGAVLSLALAGFGHKVMMAYVPFIKWQEAYTQFDQDLYSLQIQDILKPASDLIDIYPLLNEKTKTPLPPELSPVIKEVSARDVQYTLQVEDFDHDDPLYHLRIERNTQAALAALSWLTRERPDALITPNGSILEMGAVYAVARHLGIPVVTYEFGEQRGRIWLAHNREVMRQETDELWDVYKDSPLDETQWRQIRDLYASRRGADLWENFARKWQGQPVKGSQKVRQELGLDDRPIVLLPANVIGDSLTLGRQVFSESMTEWLQNTVQYFAGRQDIQLLVRIHPGERYISGPSVAEVLKEKLPELACQGNRETGPNLDHIHLIAALDPVNTYDLIEMADLGLAYTTTVGMEMAMSGVPVVLAGQTHYRGKGFSLDPTSWEDYYRQIDQALADPKALRLSPSQVEQAWNYAYRFFFAFPLPFPWHLLDLWEKLDEWPMARLFTEDGRNKYGDTFRYLAGEARDWPVTVSQGGA